MSESKIDYVINELIDKVRDNGRGFVLDLAAANREKIAILIEEVKLIQKNPDAYNPQQVFDVLDRLYQCYNDTSIEVRESLPPVDEYIPLALRREHHLLDTDSFIRYTQKYGDKDTSLVMYHDSGATLVINETLERGDREYASIVFNPSYEWAAWNTLLNTPISHKELFGSIRKLAHTLVTPEMLDAMRQVRTNAQVNTESDVQEDAKTLGVIIKTSAGEDLKKFPKIIPLELPVLDQDVMTPEGWARPEIHLAIDLPDDPRGGVSFTLTCPEWDMLFKKRIAEEGYRIATDLKDFTVLNGKADYRQRRIGRGE